MDIAWTFMYSLIDQSLYDLGCTPIIPLVLILLYFHSGSSIIILLRPLLQIALLPTQIYIIINIYIYIYIDLIVAP